MAQSKSAKPKRPPGTGSIVVEKMGLAIRWPEYVIGKDAKRRRKYRYEFIGDVSERKANRILTDRIADSSRAGAQQEKEIPTFAEHAERWQRDVLPMYEKHSTRVGHAGNIHKHLVPRFGEWPIDTIGTQDIQQFFRELDKQGYAPNSLYHYREVFRAVMQDAVSWYDLPRNPVTGVKLPKLKPVRPQWALTANQAGALIRSIVNVKARVMVALAIVAGMRRGELLAVRWQCLDQTNSQVEVKEASYLGQLGSPKTDAGTRKIDVDPWIFGMLQEWRRQSKRTRPEDFIFGTRTGKLENPNNILRRYVYVACDRLGIPRANWLTFRRTYQSWLHEKGTPARTIADLVGHTNVETQFIYVQKATDGARKEAARKIGEELSRFCPDESNQPLLNHAEEKWLN